MMIKFLSAIPFRRRFFRGFLKGFSPIPCLDSLQISIFIEESQFSCHLHHHQKKTKKTKITIGNPASNAFYTVPLKAFSQSLASVDSNSPYSLRNFNFCATSTTTPK